MSSGTAWTIADGGFLGKPQAGCAVLLTGRGMPAHGTELPISDVRCHGEYWGQSGLAWDIVKMARMTQLGHRQPTPGLPILRLFDHLVGAGE